MFVVCCLSNVNIYINILSYHNMHNGTKQVALSDIGLS